jgi:hypothetical protein
MPCGISTPLTLGLRPDNNDLKPLCLTSFSVSSACACILHYRLLLTLLLLVITHLVNGRITCTMSIPPPTSLPDVLSSRLLSIVLLRGVESVDREKLSVQLKNILTQVKVGLR